MRVVPSTAGATDALKHLGDQFPSLDFWKAPNGCGSFLPQCLLFFLCFFAPLDLGVPCKTHLIVLIARGYVCGQLPRPTTK